MTVIIRNWITKEDIEFPSITLYKYRDWHNPDTPFQDNVLLKNEMYIPSPNDFEDIRDCRNPTRYDKLSDDEIVELCSIRLRDMHPKYNDITISRMAKGLAANPDLRNPDWLREFEENWFKKECEHRGVLSMTSNPLRSEMWDKYANQSRGLCYGFNPLGLVYDLGLGSGGIVEYDDLPEISPFDELEVQIQKRVYCKEKLWGFEEEYRFGRFGNYDRVQHYRNETLTELTLGELFPVSGVDSIVELLKEKGSVAQLFRCVNNNGLLSRETIEY
jgi:hypothetical protein